VQDLIKQLEATGEAVVRVDGPYGGDLPPEWLHYSRLVIFAGGIGVRPARRLVAWVLPGQTACIRAHVRGSQ